MEGVREDDGSDGLPGLGVSVWLEKEAVADGEQVCTRDRVELWDGLTDFVRVALGDREGDAVAVDWVLLNVLLGLGLCRGEPVVVRERLRLARVGEAEGEAVEWDAEGEAVRVLDDAEWLLVGVALGLVDRDTVVLRDIAGLKVVRVQLWAVGLQVEVRVREALPLRLGLFEGVKEGLGVAGAVRE